MKAAGRWGAWTYITWREGAATFLREGGRTGSECCAEGAGAAMGGKQKDLFWPSVDAWRFSALPACLSALVGVVCGPAHVEQLSEHVSRHAPQHLHQHQHQQILLLLLLPTPGRRWLVVVSHLQLGE